MIIDKNISKYIVFAEDSILNALRKISDNRSRVVFSVTQTGRLEGILTDGDFRRWLVGQDEIDLNKPVSRISNKAFQFAHAGDEARVIEGKFSARIEFVPLLDASGHLVAIAHRRAGAMRIGRFEIGADSPVFVIAEIGNNHNGSLEMAKRLIDEAVAAGADCAKFQMRHLPSLYKNRGNANDAAEDLGSQYTLDLLSKFQLGEAELLEAIDYCRKQGIQPLCTPWEMESLLALDRAGADAYKVASADLTNHDLLLAMAKTGKPMLVSTGMSTEAEIAQTVALLKGQGAMYALLHCNSTYPAPFKDVNLNYLARLREIGDCPVGYSGHERGYHVALAAVAKGAKIIEKHFTLDRSLEGNDHKVSLLPDEFRRMVAGIREVEESLGSGSERGLSQGELINRETLAKSLVINCALEPGAVIEARMIEVKSPGKGLQPNRRAELVGRHARRRFAPGDFFFPSDVDGPVAQPRRYRFGRPWGLPVRYHDFARIAERSNPDLLEFHLSYKDLEQDIDALFRAPLPYDLVVHCPELFAGDHLLDLCSADAAYRKHSIGELQRVIDQTRALRRHFRSERPQIIVNVGGFSADTSLAAGERKAFYDRLAESLRRVDAKGVELLPQTMPPFPWHFGGQRHHNIFVDAAETARFCAQHKLRVCLDVSHSKLACTHYKWSFGDFVRELAPHVAHLHLCDASGVDGEGLQVGEGEIDFPALGQALKQGAPAAGFIPEVWQGHKNDGEGFWLALERLEAAGF